jgi:hypothetical protein
MVIFRPLRLGFKGGNNGCRLIEERRVFKLGGGGSHGGLAWQRGYVRPVVALAPVLDRGR